jgi:hypothetical protein
VNYLPTNTPPGGSVLQGERNYPSFPDIFKHAWPVLWEKPRTAIYLALFLAIVQLAIDLISNGLMAPYAKDFQAAAQAAAQGNESLQKELYLAVLAHGKLRLFLAFLIHFLGAPFMGFCLAKGALSIWDGFTPEPRDIWVAIAKYPVCLIIFIILCVYAFVLAFITIIMGTPMFMVGRLSASGANFLIMLLAVAASVFLWCRLIWPVVRRFLFLQFFLYFHISDYPNGSDRVSMWDFDQYLKHWPTHLNYMALCTLLSIMAIFIPVTLLQEIFLIISESTFVQMLSEFVAQFLIFLGLLWPSLAIAGFYRLCLFPPEDELPGPTGPEEAPNNPPES